MWAEFILLKTTLTADRESDNIVLWMKNTRRWSWKRFLSSNS